MNEAPVAVALPDEIVQFIQSGLSIVVAVVGADGRAQPGRAVAVRVVADGTLRLIYSADGNTAITAAARSGGPVAVTFSAPLSHRTIQIKGFSCKAEQLESEDQISAERQSEVFAAILGALGFTPAFVRAFRDYRSSELHVLGFSAHAAFEQTPGPGAGRSM